MCKWWADAGLDKKYKLSDVELPAAPEDESDFSSETDSPPIDPHALDHLMVMCQALSDPISTSVPAPPSPEAANMVVANAAEVPHLPPATVTPVFPASGAPDTAKGGHVGNDGSGVSGVGASARGSDIVAGEAGAVGKKGEGALGLEVGKEDKVSGADKGSETPAVVIAGE